jgi:GT2 family glycosyltransferase
MHAISVIISNFNGAKYLPRLIESLRAQQGVDLQIIVVDRNSRDASDSILADHPDIEVLKHPPETGLVSGYHAGTSLARHDLFFFMNEDMWMEPHCLRHCADLALQRQEIAAVMPVQWTYDGMAIVNAGVWYERCFWHRSRPVGTRSNAWHLVARPAQLPYANAGACLVRRSAYLKVGGWDTSFFLDDEDTDLGIRFWQHRLECWVHPDAIIGHAVGASNTKTIPGTGSPVSRKRHVAALSNSLVLAFKSFSLTACWRPILVYADWLARDVLKGRFNAVVLDLKAALLTLRRLGDVVDFRHANATQIACRPGESFFEEPSFQYSTTVQNVSQRESVAESIPT